MPLLADITLSTEALAVVGALFGTLGSALVILWKEQRANDQREKADLRKQRDDLLQLVVRRNLAHEIPPSVPDSAIPPKPPPWV